MKFEEALLVFTREITIEYGVRNPVLKIELERAAFERIVLEGQEWFRYCQPFPVLTPSQLSEGFQFIGIEVVPRRVF